MGPKLVYQTTTLAQTHLLVQTQAPAQTLAQTLLLPIASVLPHEQQHGHTNRIYTHSDDGARNSGCLVVHGARDPNSEKAASI